MDFKFKAKESPGLLFWQVSTLWKRKINNALASFSITHTQYVILAIISYLSQTDEKITQVEISNLSMIDVMTISKTVRLLEKKKLIQRYEDADDSRAKILKLTSEAKQLLPKAIAAVEDIDSSFFTSSNVKFSNLIDLLKILKNNNTN